MTNIPRRGANAREFHKYQSDIIAVEKAPFKLVLEDKNGRKKDSFLGTGNDVRNNLSLRSAHLHHSS